MQRIHPICSVGFLSSHHVCNHARKFQDVMIGTCRQIQLSHRRPHQTPTFILYPTKLPNLPDDEEQGTRDHPREMLFNRVYSRQRVQYRLHAALLHKSGFILIEFSGFLYFSELIQLASSFHHNCQERKTPRQRGEFQNRLSW